MTRTYTQVSHTARTLGIAGLIICASFFAYAAPASAASSTGSMSAGSQQTGGGGGASERGIGNYMHMQNSDGEGAPSSPADQITRLEERIKKLDAMKAQLQTLIDTLKHSSSTMSHRPECSVRDTSVSSTTQAKREKGVSPFNCRSMSQSSSTPSWGAGFENHTKDMHGTSTKPVRPSFGGRSATSTNFFSGHVLGASTNLDAEFAASLDDLRSTLIDLGNELSS